MFTDELTKYITDILAIKYDPYLAELMGKEKEVDSLIDLDYEGDIVQIKNSLQKLDIIYKYLNTLVVGINMSDIFVEVEKDMESRKLQYTKQVDDILNKYERLTLDVIEAKKREAELLNEGKLEENNQYNSKFIELEKKRVELAKYNNEIVDIVNSYNLTAGEIELNTEGLGYEELSNLYDEGIQYMSANRGTTNPIKQFREMFPNDVFQLSIIGTLVLLCFTVILDIFAIAFFVGVYILMNKSNTHNGFIITIYGLLYSVSPLEFCKSLDSEELISIESIGEDVEEAQELLKQAELELEEWDVDAVNKLHSDLSTEMLEHSDEIEDMLNSRVEDFEVNKNTLITMIKQFSKELKEEYDIIINNSKKLGDSYNESPVMDTRYVLGLRDDVVLEYVDVGLRNITIKTSSDSVKMKKFLQVMLANALMSVKPGSLVVDVYDPNKFGQDILSLYSAELETVFNLGNSSLEKLLEDLKGIAMKNMKLFKDKTINEYNKESVELGRTPKPYRLLMVLSQPKKIEEDEALKEFMRYSASYGILVWLVSDIDIPDTYVFDKPFDGVSTPYEIDLNKFGSMISSKLIYGIEHSKTDSLMWDTFVDIAIPDDKFWTYDCDEFIDLDPGFWEGDPTQYQGYTLGNTGNIHAIGVGGTGAGKSVLLNNLIANATRKYSPKNLELWLIDFKGVEFKFYLGEIMLPHIKTCLCTSDGDFGGSVFKALRTEAERRYNLLKEEGHKNIYTYNRQMRKEGKEDRIIKRILAVNDEFQVIFEKAEDKVKSQIIADIIYISKVARAAGIHLFFTSQSMKGTVSDDVLQQFTLRFGLRCDRDVSLSVMGTTYAGDIKEKNGYLYVRSLEDSSLEAQRLYRTPFIPDGMLRGHINRCHEEAMKMGYTQKNVITYEEDTVHDVSEIKEFYENNQKHVPEYGAIVLGKRMVYDENMAPQNVILGKENNTHIVSAFSNTVDLVMFFKSVLVNIDNHRGEGSSVLCNAQVSDLHYLCTLDEVGDESTRIFSNIDTTVYSYVSLIDTLVESRKVSGKTDKPVYIFLIGWDKAVGFGVDKDMMLVNKLAVVMQTCGVLNIHIIMISSSAGDLAGGIVSAASTLIAGKSDDNTSYKLTNSKLSSKVYDGMDSGYMFVNKKGDISRVKIYQSTVEREIVATEIIIKE